MINKAKKHNTKQNLKRLLTWTSAKQQHKTKPKKIINMDLSKTTTQNKT